MHTHLYPYQAPSVPQETWMNSDPDSGSPESHCVPGHRMTSSTQTRGDRQSPNCSDEQKPILTYMTIGNHTQIATHKSTSPLPGIIFKYTQTHTHTLQSTHSHESKYRADLGLIIATTWFNLKGQFTHKRYFGKCLFIFFLPNVVYILTFIKIWRKKVIEVSNMSESIYIYIFI